MGSTSFLGFSYPKGGSYGNKILYKNLKFFDKIFVRRRFRNALVDGEILCLGIISEYLYMLFYAGEIQNSNCRRLEMATYFLLTRG